MCNVGVRARSRGFGVLDGCRWNVYYGSTAGGRSEFYMVKSCGISTTWNTTGCDGGTEFTCWVRNDAVFGDKRRHVFRMSGAGEAEFTGALADGAVAIPPEDYEFTERPWYTQLNMPGWSAPYEFASGGSGMSYSVAFEGGVGAADRISSEPCSQCEQDALSSSPDGKISQATAAAMAQFGGETDIAGVKRAIKALLQAAKSAMPVKTRPLPVTYVSFANEDNYVVFDCRRSTAVCSEGHLTYQAGVRNTAVFGDGRRHMFNVNASFEVVGDEVSVSGSDYVATSRPFYTWKRGWGVAYGSFSSGEQVMIRTYSYPVGAGGAAGTAGVSWYEAEAPECKLSESERTCLAASYAVPGAGAAAKVGEAARTAVTTVEGVGAECGRLLAAVKGMSQGFM